MDKNIVFNLLYIHFFFPLKFEAISVGWLEFFLKLRPYLESIPFEYIFSEH